MSTAKAQSKVRLVRSENKWGRSNRRHLARQNRRKKTSEQYEKKFKNVQLSQFSADKWIPCPSGYSRGQGWHCLIRAWLGYIKTMELEDLDNELWLKEYTRIFRK